ncbi:MAG TPA: lamin tail domain-containing protein [Longimicrobium sp.]|nr:lamin tail domain-containing protein [Longimicrobium sp.]
MNSSTYALRSPRPTRRSVRSAMWRGVLAALFPALSACSVGSATTPRPPVVINEIMADPARLRDDAGEWFEVHNRGSSAVSLRGWTIESRKDSPHTIAAALSVPAGGYVVLARTRTAGAAYEYGGAVSLANSADHLVLRDAAGELVDSVAWKSVPTGASRGVVNPAAEHSSMDGPNWRTSTSPFGAGDLGTPGARNDGSAQVSAPAPSKPARAPAPAAGPASELVVRVLDVGQGDATLISNGTTKVLIDGGPDASRMGRLLDSLQLNGTTIDVVIMSHPHYDHHAGLRELFRASREIRVRFFFENGDPSTNGGLRQLRDSVAARARRGELVFRDTDDPCANNTPVCTIRMNGGARIHVMRPFPGGREPNDRSTPVKLVGPDSASFSMWFAGDAEHDAIDWFATGSGYDRAPGMRVTVLKGNHHGSCNGADARYLRLLSPEWVTLSLAARNEYGHAHAQAKTLFSRAGIPWYRTDQNGTITFRSPGTPGGGYTVAPQRGARNADGPSDRRSTQGGCEQQGLGIRD